MAEKGNVEDFVELIGSGFCVRSVGYYTKDSPNKVFDRRFRVGNYTVDYRRPLLHYHKACGCNIDSTNNNWWDDCFWICYTKPTKAVDPRDWFENEYKPGIYWSANLKLLLATVILVLLIIAMITYTNYINA